MRTILLLVVALPLQAQEPKAQPLAGKATLIAHRGASGLAPEHTMAAYRLAIEHRADFVEPDLQMTKDGVLVCLHDTTLERTTNVAAAFPDRAKMVGEKKTWPVSDFTLAEIKKLDAGSWKDKKFAGERVPTLQEMLDLCKGKAGIIPETKAPEVYGKLGLNMEQALMKLLKENKLDERNADRTTPVVIQSFSAASLKSLLKDHQCKLPLVYLFDGRNAPKTKADIKAIREYAEGIAPNKAALLARPAMADEAHALGMSVTVWTFRSGQTGKFATVKDEIRHFVTELKVDAIFTDNPEEGR